MKRFTKHLALLVTFLLTSVSASAYSFKKGGIYYDITNTTSHTVSVTYLYYISSSTSNSAAYTGEVIIPATVTYNGIEYSVTSINDYAFYSCSGLTSVTIPNSVTSIGTGAFKDCSGLTSVTIPNSVTSIGKYAFMDCSGLTSVTIPNSVTSIGSNAFFSCSGIKDVYVILTDEDDFANYIQRTDISKIFHNDSCSGKTHHIMIGGEEQNDIAIPSSVTSIGSYAFSNCRGLTSVTIPNSVTSIGTYAFQSCSGLTSVTIPNSVTSIGTYAFSGCSGLTSVTIPNSVTSIGTYAFSGCM